MTKNGLKHPYQLGLSLSGGGARGFAHLGVIKALEEYGIAPDIIAGTSAGAFAGALYASGNSPDEILRFFEKKVFKTFAELTIPKTGIFKTDRFKKFLKEHIKVQTFEELKTPMRIIATDLVNGVSVCFDKGPVIPAVMASCAYPIIFTPVKIENNHYTDGGLFKNFPVSTIRDDCQTVIGVNASPLTTQKYKDSLLYIAERAFHYVSASNSILDRKLCDILIETDRLSKYPMFSTEHAHEIFEIGYEVALMELNKQNNPLLTSQLNIRRPKQSIR
ncbi:MAG: hypothetical protein RL662_2092 [Bacteroidota bacterium]|jgi:NTE family protein